MARYRIVAGRSRIETEMTSNVHPIHAAAEQVSGVIEGHLDARGVPDYAAPYRARFEVPIVAMHSGNRLQDMEMQRRMDAREHPSITVTVNRAWQVDRDEVARGRARFEVEAHGRSRPYEGDFSVRVEGRRLIVEGEQSFDMRDFGVDPPRFMGLKVNPEVKVKVRIEAEEDGIGGNG